MIEQTHTIARKGGIGGCTYEEAECLLGIASKQIRKLAAEIAKTARPYLDASLLEEVWRRARPFVVSLRRADGQDHGGTEGGIEPDDGDMLAADVVQLRFATMTEARREAHRQPSIPGYEWIVTESNASIEPPGRSTRTLTPGNAPIRQVAGGARRLAGSSSRRP